MFKVVDFNDKFSQDNIGFPRREKIRPRLPDISLPIFDGEFSKWREYLDTFKAIVHSNSNLSNTVTLKHI